MSGKKLFLIFSGFLTVIAVAVFVVSSRDGAIGGGLKTRRKSSFTAEIAEGVSVQRRGCYGVDFIRCGSCRVEKRKLGALTLGCFNVLCLDDLSIVIPDEMRARSGGGEQPSSNEVSAVELARRLGVGGDFLRIHGQMPSFSGLRVTKLAVSTLDAGSNVALRCVAVRGEAKRDGLHLEGCSVIDGSRTNFVGTALLAVKPDLKVVWRGGEMRF